jgi:two-component system sensor histidine kinase CpxA
MRETVVNGDADMLRHAVENIVRNAIRYSPPHGIVEIHIDTEECDHRSMAVVSVVDTGPGVSEDELKLILNPFYRAQKFHHGSTSGFGVGLAIADRAALLHGGEIVARNKKDGGLIIDMFLPLSV